MSKYHDCGVEGLTFTQPSLCHSEFAADCDLKTILDRFMRLGQLPPNVGGFSADVTAMPESFDDLQIGSARIRQAFEQQPLEVQQQFESPEDWYLSTLQDTSDQATQDKPVQATQDKPVQATQDKPVQATQDKPVQATPPVTASAVNN